MHVSHLSLHHFRSHRSLEVALAPGATVFLGHNGQGKTNIVEAVDYLSRLASHRVATDAPLVEQGADRAVVRAAVVRGGRTATLEVEVNPGRANRARVNRAEQARARDIVGLLRTVLFSPEDLALAKGDPAERRRYLDDLLLLRTPRLAGVRADYDRVLRQRNALLKAAGPGRGGGEHFDSTLAVWDQQLVRLGAEITVARARLVQELSPFLAEAYAAVAKDGGRTEASARYLPSVPLRSRGHDAGAAGGERSDPGLDQEGDQDPDTQSTPKGAAASAATALRTEVERSFAEALDRRAREELQRGITLVGPHRDEVALEVGTLPVKGYASHGESWSFALAMRLAAYSLLRQDGDDPVLILDDVFAELDTDRRDRLAELVADAEQVLVTAAVAEDVPRVLRGVTIEVRREPGA